MTNLERIGLGAMTLIAVTIATVWIYAAAHSMSDPAPILPCELPQAQHDFHLQAC